MKRAVLLFLFISFSILSHGQSLTSLNYNHWYDPSAEVYLPMQVVKGTGKIQVYYRLQSKLLTLDKYSITWEKRESYTQKQGTVLTQTDSASIKSKNGAWSFDLPEKPWLLVASVINTDTQKKWVFFQRIEANYPVIGWLESNGKMVDQNFVTLNQSYTIKQANEQPLFVSFYKEAQPAAVPPFAESVNKADRFIFHDSTFRLQHNQSLVLKKQGVYLFQKDTNAAEGFAVRAVDKVFPKFSSIDDLRGPLIFICTQDEYKKLLAAGDDKAKFDNVILDITKDKERAKNFMRNYFRRVELSNTYFTAYKEGWKTDRGMIYLIYGVPDEITVNDGTETWYYITGRSRFTFVKSGSVYDPENFVLLRDKRFTDSWYSTIDLWRKSRF